MASCCFVWKYAGLVSSSPRSWSHCKVLSLWGWRSWRQWRKRTGRGGRSLKPIRRWWVLVPLDCMLWAVRTIVSTSGCVSGQNLSMLYVKTMFWFLDNFVKWEHHANDKGTILVPQHRQTGIWFNLRWVTSDAGPWPIPHPTFTVELHLLCTQSFNKTWIYLCNDTWMVPRGNP